MSKRLIVRPAYSGDALKVHQATLPALEAYAAKVGADLKVLSSPSGLYDLAWEKWTYKDFMDRYDQILHIDADALVRPDCPDLFSLVPPMHFAGVDEHVFAGPTWERPYVDRYVELRKFGEIIPQFYVNVGVFLVSSAQYGLFLDPPDHRGRYAEQTQINYLLHRDHHRVHLLPWQYNYMLLMEKAGLPKAEAHIIHYAGRWGGLSIDKLLKRIEDDKI